MNRTKKFLTGVLLTVAASTASATLINIEDKYIGAGDANDVLGNPLTYNISSMDVNMLANNILSVSINTKFAGKTAKSPSLTQDGNGISYGDLFLSSGWTPFGSEPYAGDNASNGNVWTYGFSLDNRHVNDNTTGTLYVLNGADNDANALLSEEIMVAGTSFRGGHEVEVDLTGEVEAQVGNSSWSVTPGQVNFLIDLTGTELEQANQIGLHWTMGCANDVIEGQYNVPEPAILGLLALGLLGIGVSKRKNA